MNDPMLQEAIQAVKSDCYKAIESSKFRDLEDREEAYKVLRAVNAVEGKLRLYIGTGKLAESNIEKFKNKLMR